jgi:hypothetical protein
MKAEKLDYSVWYLYFRDPQLQTKHSRATREAIAVSRTRSSTSCRAIGSAYGSSYDTAQHRSACEWFACGSRAFASGLRATHVRFKIGSNWMREARERLARGLREACKWLASGLRVARERLASDMRGLENRFGLPTFSGYISTGSGNRTALLALL